MNKFAEISSNKNPADLVPHSIEAEQQLLGGLLNNNDLFYSLEDKIKGEHFYDPVHSRIFDVIANRINEGKLASAVTVSTFLTEDEGLKELGGSAYLAKLMAGSVASSAIKDYSKLVYDLAIRRELIVLGQEISSRAQSVKVDEKSEDQIILAEQNLYKIGDTGKSETDFKSFLKAIHEAVDVANAAHHRDGNLAGISTGFIDLDKKMGGLHSSDLIILAGRPSMGKTSLATNIAYNITKSFKKVENSDAFSAAENGGIVGFFSLEMSAEQLAARILSETAEIPSEQIRRGDMTENEFRRFVEAAKSIQNAPLFIDDTPALNIAQLASRARRLKRTHGLDALIIDYLQLVRAASNRESRVNEISEIKQEINNNILKNVKEAAFDCAIYNKDDGEENLQCFNIQSTDPDAFSYYPDISIDDDDTSADRNKKEITLKPVTIKGIKYAYDKKSGKLYEYTSSLSQTPVQVGTLTIKEDGNFKLKLF